MKPFTLDTVLKHRKNLETQAIQRLVKAREEKNNAQDQLNKEEGILVTLIETLNREQTLGIDVVKLVQFEQRINLIEKQVLVLRTILQKKNEALNQAQVRLISKSKDRKIMETLQQKQDQAWRQYLNQKETATLDEIAVIFHGRE
ncbi:MAG: flagellar export protein FliJ [Desulfocapsaceae bacterium]|nr:flagellar export protein FliJ [Desulfocapsaceae bacterium]